jgi:hypothetical protein
MNKQEKEKLEKAIRKMSGLVKCENRNVAITECVTML